MAVSRLHQVLGFDLLNLGLVTFGVGSPMNPNPKPNLSLNGKWIIRKGHTWTNVNIWCSILWCKWILLIGQQPGDKRGQETPSPNPAPKITFFKRAKAATVHFNFRMSLSSSIMISESRGQTLSPKRIHYLWTQKLPGYWPLAHRSLPELSSNGSNATGNEI